ncbi:MAG: hypothetical protein IT290_06380 [Deltaproteobacteria bacterium]|nr:hypothetical protein [Deltaproteobacteria bacterium]
MAVTQKVLLFAIVLVPQLIPGLIGKALYKRGPTAFESIFAVLVALVVTVVQGTILVEAQPFAVFASAMLTFSFLVMFTVHFFRSERIGLALVCYALAAACGITLNYVRNVDRLDGSQNVVPAESPRNGDWDPDLRSL